MSIHEEDGFAVLTFEPRLLAFLASWVHRDAEAMKSLGSDEEIDFKEVLLSMLFLWENAVKVGEIFGGPSIEEVIEGMGLALAQKRLENGDD